MCNPGPMEYRMREKNTPMQSIAFVLCLLCVSSAMAQNLIVNGDFSAGNLFGWTGTPNAPSTITYDVSAGHPSGSALLARNDSSATANGNYLYQVIPVVNGAQYKLSAEWKGDLLNGGTGRNWAEVYINFTDTNTTFSPGTIRYKKATDGGPNDTPMPWDWESIATSPDSSNPGPSNGVFTATGNYMTIAFNLGGRALTSNNTQPGYYRVDNVSLTSWPPSSAPVFTSISRSGGNIVLQGTNGPSNGAYEMLHSTNVSAAVADWQGLGIRGFDVNGDFNFTNSLNSQTAAAFYRLRVVSSAPVFPPAITRQPPDVNTSVGSSASFNVRATGSALIYRWYFNTNTLFAGVSGTNLTLNNLQLTNSGTISVSVSNLLGSVSSDFATLTVTNSTQPPFIQTQPTNLVVSVGQTAGFGITADGALPLAYQWYYNTNTMLTGQTNRTLTLSDVQLTNEGVYSVTITNLYGSTNSDFATLTVNSNFTSQLIGWASVAGYGLETTTGGGNATPQLVSDLATLRTLAGDSTPRVLILSGTFVTGSSPISIASDKTLRGTNNATIQGGIDIRTRSNIIIQNLNIQANGFGNTPVDAAAARTTHHLWFDHVTFSDAGDGLLDLTVGSDYITVSWCKFYYTDPNNTHRLCSLVGNGSTSTTDTNKNNVTYHHNWFSTLVDQRMPRLLFGKGHMFNNYYNAPGNSYCIGTGSWGSALVENNYFKQVNSPHKFQDTNPSYITATGNIYDNCTGSQNTGLGFPLNDGNDPGPWIPPYSYTLDPTANVPAPVTAGAGAH